MLYCTEMQRDMTVADLLQIVDIVADYVVLRVKVNFFLPHPPQ